MTSGCLANHSLRALAERVGNRSTTSLRSRSTNMVPNDWPLLHAQSSTPRTRTVGCEAEPRAPLITWRSSVWRLDGIPSRFNTRWPERPPNARPTSRWTSLKRTVCCECGSRTPATRSVKIWRTHSRRRQRQRPSNTLIVTHAPCSGRSRSFRQ
ncbi:MAG: hypothetical protein QOJ51_6772 [Acidobacteriaceae bacterium]|nr:hypothetical protein [Acidobacteriaceae bacterium]